VRLQQNTVSYLSQIQEFQAAGYSLKEATVKVNEGVLLIVQTKADLKAKAKLMKDDETAATRAENAARSAQEKAENAATKLADAAPLHAAALSKRDEAAALKTQEDNEVAEAGAAVASSDGPEKGEAVKRLKLAQSAAKQAKTGADQARREFDAVDKKYMKIKEVADTSKAAAATAKKKAETCRAAAAAAKAAYEELRATAESVPAPLAIADDEKAADDVAAMETNGSSSSSSQSTAATATIPEKNAKNSKQDVDAAEDADALEMPASEPVAEP
jgi:hypothetical protein